MDIASMNPWAIIGWVIVSIIALAVAILLLAGIGKMMSEFGEIITILWQSIPSRKLRQDNSRRFNLALIITTIISCVLCWGYLYILVSQKASSIYGVSMAILPILTTLAFAGLFSKIFPRK